MWELNERIGARLVRLADYLAIGGYEPAHAAGYRRLGRAIAGWPESLETLRHEGRLRQIPGVGPATGALLTELVDTGTCAKWEDWKARVPESVLDLAEVPGLGASLARTLFLGFGIDGLPALEAALAAGALTPCPGLGPKRLAAIRRHLAGRQGR